MKPNFLSFSLLNCLMLGMLFGLSVPMIAQTEPLPFWEKVGTADLIVTGILLKVEGDQCQFMVDEWAYGTLDEPDSDLIRIQKYQGATPRWEPYEIGQRVMLFLKRESDEWVIMGGNGEGEHLIFQDQVYVDNRGGGIWDDFEAHTIRGRTLSAEPVLKKEMLNAIADFRKCFRLVQPTEAGKRIRIKQLVNEKELKKNRFYSDVFDQLIVSMETWYAEHK